jgi:hypothetical protein
MPDWNKPDWNKEVRARMTKLKLPPDTKEEVIAELSAHLEDINDDPSHAADCGTFLPSENAWRKLARAIWRAKREETLMNRRIKSLWLPSLANLMAASALMIFLDYFNLDEPGIATFGHIAKAFRLPWFLALPVLGALGAWLAKRARGSSAELLTAGLAPSLVWLAVMVTVGLSLILDPRHFAGISLSDFAFSTLGLVILPALALLIGTLPFLGNSRPQPQE